MLYIFFARSIVLYIIILFISILFISIFIAFIRQLLDAPHWQISTWPFTNQPPATLLLRPCSASFFVVSPSSVPNLLLYSRSNIKMYLLPAFQVRMLVAAVALLLLLCLVALVIVVVVVAVGIPH